MAFKKGQSGNPFGRKRGSLNKSTKELRAIIKEVLSTNFTKTKIKNDLNELSPKQRLEFYFKLLEYTLSKPTGPDTDDNEDSPSDFINNIIEQMNAKRNPDGSLKV